MARKRQIIISKDDHQRLESLFQSRFVAMYGDQPYLQSLRGELGSAKIVAPGQVPPDIVTMNSTVRLSEVGSQETDVYTLVYPQHANIAEGKLSVLAPIGTAILGYRVGDVVRWKVPRGMAKFRIDELVFQPERDEVVV